MYKIVVCHNKIIINDYKLGDCPLLEKNFEVFNKATHMYDLVGIKFDTVNKTATIPRGVDINFIENLFGVKAIYNYSYIEPIKNQSNILLKYMPKDDTQKEAIAFMLGNGKYSYTKDYDQQLIALDTGAGKTYLGIAYISFMNEKAIIITSSTEWLSQWENRIIEHTNTIDREIMFIRGSSEIENLLRKNKLDIANKYKIYLVTHSTLLSYAKENSWESIRTLFSHLGIGIKIYDEAHLNFENIYNIDYAASVHKTLYLTATPGRGEARQNSIFKLYFKNIPTLSLYNNPHTNYISIHYKSNLNAVEISKCVNYYGFNKTMYCNMVVTKTNFDYVCRIVFDVIEKINGKKLIFLATNDAIIYMYQWIRYNYPEYKNDIGIFTSINEDKSEALTHTIILTTSKSAGAALDIKDLMVSVNLAEPTKSKPQNKQRFGRTRAYGSYYIDVIDNSLKIISNYFKDNYSLFEKYALSMKNIKFNDKMLEDTAMKIMLNRQQKFGISPFQSIPE